MRNQKQTIHKAVGILNNQDEDGGFWLPNIQRPFVWSEEQICRLFDSILREYPFGTLLVWKTVSTIRRRKFIDNWKDSIRLSDFYVPEDSKKKGLVLDGQQRLQSLFIGLSGSYENRELYFDILSGEVAAPDDIKFRFKFLDGAAAQFPWVRFKDLIVTSRKKREILDGIRLAANRPLSEAEKNKLEDHFDLAIRVFRIDELLTYQELDSIDNPDLYSEDDVVEVFIRANSGGTRLGKSDLLFSLLAASWEVANDEMEELLDDLNRFGFKFDRDFVLKTALAVLGQGARYEVEKFRRPGIRENVEEKWQLIAGAIKSVLDFVRGKTFIQGDKGLPTYLVLIPLVYVRYHFPDSWKKAKGLDTYLLRASLAGAFSGNPDNLLDAIIKKLDEVKGFDLDEVFGVIRSQGRSLELTPDRFWHLGYGSDLIHIIFNLWYKDFDYVPAYENSLPQIDHIFAQSLLREVKVTNPETGRKLLRYRDVDRNQLANCMLLTREENGGGGKRAQPPNEWFADKSDDYLDRHLIPRNRSLWALDRFDEFIAARKKLIEEKFSYLLVSPKTHAEADLMLQDIEPSEPRESAEARAEEFRTLLSAYDAMAPGELKSYGNAPRYRQVRPADWPEKFRIHYEFMAQRRSFWCELHLESVKVASLAPVLQGFAGTSVGPNARTIEWDASWRGLGRLRVAHDREDPPEEIARTMLDLVAKTRERVTQSLQALENASDGSASS